MFLEFVKELGTKLTSELLLLVTRDHKTYLLEWNIHNFLSFMCAWVRIEPVPLPQVFQSDWIPPECKQLTWDGKGSRLSSGYLSFYGYFRVYDLSK